MISSSFSGRLAIASLLLLGLTACERDLDMLEPAEFPSTATVFQEFGVNGLAFQPFAGASLTAYSIGEKGFVAVIEGRISQETRDNVLASAATAERFDTLKSRGKVYYRVQGDGDGNINIDDGNTGETYGASSPSSSGSPVAPGLSQ